MTTKSIFSKLLIFKSFDPENFTEDMLELHSPEELYSSFYYKSVEKFNIENWYDFVTEVGDHFLEAYIPIVNKRKNTDFSVAQRAWQEIRRGRYVEFNLIHDKGTMFGLKTNGRIESILMSLPPRVQLHYNHQTKANSPEEELINVLKNPREWV